MKKRLLMTALLASAPVFTFATSDNLIQGQAVYLKGDPASVISNGWGAGVAGTRFQDDGTGGDATSNDNIYTRQITGLTPATAFVWKAADDSYSPVNSPDSGGDNLAGVVGASGTITFNIRTTAFGDGYVPDYTGSGSFADGVAYSDGALAAFATATSIEMVGDFQSENSGGSGTDWDATSAGTVTLTPSGGGIYTGSVTGLPAGGYNFKIVLNDSFSPAAVGGLGFATTGANLSMTFLDPSNTVTVTFNANTGRTLVDNPAATAGPPFYAQSTAWSTGFGAAEQLSPNGSTYQRTFTVATPGTYSVRVRQGLGRPFPDTGDYPFTTTAPNQVVRVVFDRNTYADGYKPTADFVVVLDDATRAPLNTWAKVQPVGNWQDDFGGAEWDANVGAFDLADGGSAPDATAGDAIFSGNLLSFAANTNQNLKAVGQRLGGTDTGFAIQFGGNVDGLTVSGNNSVDGGFDYPGSGGGTPVTFKVDTVTGRIAGGASAASEPTRGAYFSASSVADWSMY